MSDRPRIAAQRFCAGLLVDCDRFASGLNASILIRPMVTKSVIIAGWFGGSSVHSGREKGDPAIPRES